MSLHDDYELSVQLIFCPSWPHHCSPLSNSTDLIRVVQNTHRSHQSGPLVVVDRFGGTEGATFCALSTLLRHLDYENHVDVYQYSKVAHNRRPGIWKSQDDYLYLYRVSEAVCIDSKPNHGTSSSPMKRAVAAVAPFANGHCNGKSSVIGGGGGSGSVGGLRVPPDGSETSTSSY